MTISQKLKLAPGLYLIATPIGTARDITLRALDLLNSAELLVAEDTRSLRKLMDIHGIPLGDRPLWSYHDHSNERSRQQIVTAILAGKSVLYASEAGTPMIADPGYSLVREVLAAEADVISAPGPSAVITALTLSALPTDQFHFAGFLPNSSSRRKTAFEALAPIPATLVLYESPKRVAECLSDACAILGPSRPVALCRELTKKFEEIKRGSLREVADWAASKPLKGEVVLVIGKATEPVVNDTDIDSALRDILGSMSIRDAADLVSVRFGIARRQVYQRALALAKES